MKTMWELEYATQTNNNERKSYLKHIKQIFYKNYFEFSVLLKSVKEVLPKFVYEKTRVKLETFLLQRFVIYLRLIYLCALR